MPFAKGDRHFREVLGKQGAGRKHFFKRVFALRFFHVVVPPFTGVSALSSDLPTRAQAGVVLVRLRRTSGSGLDAADVAAAETGGDSAAVVIDGSGAMR